MGMKVNDWRLQKRCQLGVKRWVEKGEMENVCLVGHCRDNSEVSKPAQYPSMARPSYIQCSLGPEAHTVSNSYNPSYSSSPHRGDRARLSDGPTKSYTQSNSKTLFYKVRDLKSSLLYRCVCRCSHMRSCRIINSRSSSVETTEVEVLYEKQQGLKHTHTVGCHGTCAISHTHIRRLHLYNTYSSPVLIPLNCCFSSSPCTSPSFSRTIPLLSISSRQPIGSRACLDRHRSLPRRYQG